MTTRKPAFLRAAPVLMLLVLAACQSSTTRDVPSYSIEQFMGTKSIFGGSFSPDQEQIAYCSDESGVYNIFVVPVEGGQARQVTHSDSNVVALISFFPTDKRLLFRSDQGGNEVWHIYVREKVGGFRDLTPWEGARSTFEGWSHDDRSFYFSCNRRDPKYMDLYEMDIETFEPEMIYRNDAGYEVGAISNDRKYLAFEKPVTTNASEMYLFEVDTGQLKRLSPEGEDASYQPETFSGDSRSLYYLTNAGREFKGLYRYDIGEDTHTLVRETDWDIMYTTLSRNDRYRVTGINENARTTIELYERTGTPGQPGEFTAVALPALPDGDITSVRISRDETMMAFYVNSSRSPENLYVYDFESRQYNKLTDSMTPEIQADDLVEARRVTYESYDGTAIPAILYKPWQVSARNPAPALVWVHGGPGGQSRIGYSSTIQYLVNHGYVIFAVNNRGSSGYGKTFYKMDDRRHGEADLDDCVEAGKYLAGLDYVDGDRIGILGGSYGGYMVLAALAFRPEEFAVGVDLFGISNWVRTLESIPPWWEAFREALYEEMGDPSTDKERLHRISPLFHAEKIQRPLMVLQGANDPRVLQQESDEIVEAVRRNGVPVEYVLFDDEGHGFRKKENRIVGYKSVLKFLDRYLKGETPVAAH